MSQFKNSQFIICLGAIVIIDEAQSKALISETAITNTDGDMAQIVPNVGQLLIAVGQTERALETRDYHVVLLGVEAAQADVVEDLAVVDAHLHEPTVELERHFRLVVVEVVGCYVRHRFDVCSVRVENLFVVLY